MKKNDKNTELSENKPKKGFFKKLFKGKEQQKKVLNIIKTKNINNLYFYTDVNNVLLILERGIRLLKDQNLKKNEEYIVWTYLENENSIGLEFDSSTRAHFWKWASESKVDIEKISVIGIDPHNLAKLTKNDWAFDEAKNIVYIYETVPLEAIEFILIKDKANLKRIQTYVEANDIDIDVFLGETGNIDKKKERK
ncbi:acetyltransferase [Spiroplasma endosymbiont of Cantharis lateralis]|uniref:acetyltransferase n=1 Tax=Spiroplasma endosymbiont of Cantharis lateralis TaxID=3066277 RepID=UPI00313BB4CB